MCLEVNVGVVGLNQSLISPVRKGSPGISLANPVVTPIRRTAPLKESLKSTYFRLELMQFKVKNQYHINFLLTQALIKLKSVPH